jgi:hypothetical protein
MKILILCFILVQSTVLFASDQELENIRLLFHKAESSQKVCLELIERLRPYDEDNNVLFMGYRACATMLMAKHVFNPFSKLSYFKKGREMLEKAIQFDKNNIELIFLRYTIQTNVPSFLNYNESKDNDSFFLVNSLKKLNDQKLKKIITAYLSSNKTVS